MTAAFAFMSLDLRARREEWRGLGWAARAALEAIVVETFERGAPLPDDDEVIAKAIGMHLRTWRRLRPEIEPRFDLAGGVWRHLATERAHAFAVERCAQKREISRKQPSFHQAKCLKENAPESCKSKGKDRTSDEVLSPRARGAADTEPPLEIDSLIEREGPEPATPAAPEPAPADRGLTRSHDGTALSSANRERQQQQHESAAGGRRQSKRAARVPQPRARARHRKTAITAWAPAFAELASYAAEKGIHDDLEIRHLAERFFNWHVKNDCRRADWPAAWRDWVLDAVERRERERARDERRQPGSWLVAGRRYLAMCEVRAAAGGSV